MANIVYIATSIDGYIADRDNKLDWLEMVPNPDNTDLGFNGFLGRIDALVMGRNTYESVAAMGIEWPYPKPVFVYSRTLKDIPERLKDKVSIISGEPEHITSTLHKRGFTNLYIDGGKTIQSFLQADLIDEMIITKIPVLLGGGVPLFGVLPKHIEFEFISAEVLLEQMVCLNYRRKNKTSVCRQGNY